MRILVTGGAGFIGSHLAEALWQQKHTVAILDNLSTGRRENLPSAIPLYSIDLRDREKVQAHFREHTYEVIFHLAAQVDVRTSLESPIKDAEINILGTLHLLEAAQAQRPWVIFASTGGAIYGEKPYLPISEEEKPQPESPYAISKLTCELYLHYYMTVHQMPYTILRLANVYGPRQNPFGEAGVVAIFTHRLLTGKKAHIYGDGEQTRDFVYVADVVNAFLSVLAHPEKTQGQTYNVGTGIETSVNTLYRVIAEEAGITATPHYLPPKIGELRRNALSTTKLTTATGWQPAFSLWEGIRQTVETFRQAYNLR